MADADIRTVTGEEVFARRSSGLVRAASTRDASLVNIYVATFPIMVAFLLGIVLPFYPGANLYLTLLIAAALALPILVSYAVGSSVMRRSGGDYVFISRTIHPALGFAANFVFVVFQTVFLTSAGYFFCLWCLAPLARILGVYLNNASLVSFSDTLLEPLSVFITTELFVIGFGILFIVGNIRATLKVFRYTFVVSMLGLLAFAFVMIFTSQGSMVQNFDAYVQEATGVGGAAAAAAASAADGGFAIAGFAFGATLLAVTWPSFSLPYYLGSAYFAGEVRSGKKTQLLAGPLTAIVAIVGSLLLVALALSGMGREFLGSVGAADPAAMGLSANPTYMETAAAGSGNAILGVLIIIGFGSWLFPTVPMSLLIMTRCMFAWSMDRVTPSALAKVSPKTNSPYVAVIVVTALSAVVGWFWAYTDFFTVVVGAFGQVIALGIGCIAVAMIPFKYRDLYETSPIKGYIGKVPKLTIIGLLGAIGAGVIVWNFARDPFSGVNPTASPKMFWASLGLFVVGGVIYYVSKAIRKTHHVDLELAYREIPPE